MFRIRARRGLEYFQMVVAQVQPQKYFKCLLDVAPPYHDVGHVGPLQSDYDHTPRFTLSTILDLEMWNQGRPI
jgi:hypothetical protein